MTSRPLSPSMLDDLVTLDQERMPADYGLGAFLVEGGKTPVRSAAELERMGYRLVIFPNSLVRLFARQGARLLSVLRASGSTDAMREDMVDFTELNELLGTSGVIETGRRFAGGTR